MKKNWVSIFGLCAFFSVTSSLNAIPYQQLSASEMALKNHITQSISEATAHHSKLNTDVLNITGMSSPKVRHFLNNLCSLPDARYLEVGSWHGSTLISALFGNENTLADAVAIDNWSEFGGRIEFQTNCLNFLQNSKYRVFEEDCFRVNKKALFNKPINIYFFDGAHTEQSHELALTYFNDVLDDLFILVVDDWNYAPVNKGTMNAIRKLNYKVLFSNELPARFNGDTELWWNGLYVALIRK